MSESIGYYFITLVDTMKISVIVPVYNVENYIRECIQSVLSQRVSNQHELELILVDDGSSWLFLSLVLLHNCSETLICSEII